MKMLSILMKAAVTVLFIHLSTLTAQAEENEKPQILDGTTIDWTYNNSDARMVVSFEDGLAQYEWVAGSRKGRGDKEIPYKSQELSDGVVLINWVQPQKPDFISMIFDFNENVMFSSGLIGYGTERQKNLFLNGVVNSVER